MSVASVNILCVTKCQHTVSQHIVCHQVSIRSEQKCQKKILPSVNTVHISVNNGLDLTFPSACDDVRMSRDDIESRKVGRVR